MAINLHLPGKTETLRPTITVVGVGGAGGNAVNNMITSNLEGVNFVVANTDAQALENSLTERRIQLGSNLTRGLGAGANPETGRAAAEEALDEVAGYIEGSNMVFITAGMGGGTGTGAAPVIARFAKERGILTVGVVTKPFQFEGNHRMRLAEQGVRELQQFVDTLIVIPNQNLFRIANEKTTFADAFRLADEVLHSGVRGVTDLMIMPGLINLDFADIRTVMGEMGKAMMGTGEGEGPKRAIEAAEAAISNPLLDDVSMKGARGVLINITGSYDMTLFEADEAATRIREEVDPNANIIFGATFNPALEGKMRVSVVATGIDLGAAIEPKPQNNKPVEATRLYGSKLGFVAPRATEQLSKFPMQLAQTKPPEQGAPEPVKRAEPVFEQKQPAPVITRSAPAVAQTSSVSIAAQPQPVRAVSAHSDSDGNPLVVFASRMTTFIGAIKYQEEAVEQLQLPMAAGMRSPAFVSPMPAQPAQRSFFAAPEESAQKRKQLVSNQTANNARRNEETEDLMESAGTAARNLINRMANVGRVLASKPEKPERNVHVVEKSKVEVSERPQKSVSDNDYLEIPAFLRRQAN